MLALQNTILEMIARGESLQATMAALCHRIERMLEGVACSVVLVDRGGLLHPIAGPSLPPALADIVEGLAIGPAVGSCGTAIYHDRTVITPDIAADPAWDCASFAALPAGWLACWSTPIHGDSGRVLGAFAFYYREKRGPCLLEQQIVETCVHLSAIAIERQQRIDERERRATHDELTGLGNRAAFNALLARMACAPGAQWGVLALDLDNLKIVNDTYGHHVGDALLQAAAARIAQAVAPDLAFRIGGDEFIVLLQSPAALADLAAAAAHIFDTLRPPADCASFCLSIEASIGGAAFAEGDDLPDTVREHADHALYVAKASGRGRFIRYWPGIGTPIDERARIARQLEAALRDRRIEAWYQPVVDLVDGAIVGLEALCRIRDSHGRIVTSPGLALAQTEAQLGCEVTVRMLEIAALDLAMWPEGVFVAVNICPADMHVAQFAQEVTRIFAAAHVSLDRLVLDINEASGIARLDAAAVATLARLRAGGVRIALDDFGKAHAALTDLIALPVDMIKLDPSLGAAASGDPRKALVVRALTGLAGQLGMTVIAEGLEAAEQHQHMAKLGCTQGQGFHFAPALERSAVAALLASGTPLPLAQPTARARA